MNGGADHQAVQKISEEEKNIALILEKLFSQNQRNIDYKVTEIQL